MSIAALPRSGKQCLNCKQYKLVFQKCTEYWQVLGACQSVQEIGQVVAM